MSIEKMELVNIAGLMKDIDDVLLKCCQSGCFHIESAVGQSATQTKLLALNEQNPFSDVLKRTVDLSVKLSIKLKKTKCNDIAEKNLAYFESYIASLEAEYRRINTARQKALKDLTEQQQTIVEINHLKGLDTNFERIFSCKYVGIRAGKLPIDSYPKLKFYENKVFFFVPFDFDNNYCWGIYFVPKMQAPIVDEIFSSLYFERIRLPDFVTGTPEEALIEINETIDKLKLTIEKLDADMAQLIKKNEMLIKKSFSKLKLEHDVFELRKNCAVLNGKFYLVGFVPTIRSVSFSKLFDKIESVSVVITPPDSDNKHTPPTKLKNGFFARPFAMMVEMYGLPSYNGINPTVFFAITYTLLFGMMFGDLGQGAVLFLAGLFMTHKQKNKIGGILTRVGASSMIFGIIYGSVFGFEDILTPLYKLVGLKEKPIEIFHQTNLILIVSIAIGVLLICISILHNIYVGLKQKNYEKALFGPNGIAGLVLYVSAITGVVLQMLVKIKVLTAPYVIFLILLPLMIIFFRMPLGNLAKYKRFSIGEEGEGVGTFIVENFFELFEFMLSYVTNTMSFLRVGGFILSHAGMMMVVMTLAEGVSSGAAPIVIIIGNAFVMAMEGMIVAIQVMRLEFYELFSRFYEGDGVPFVPVGVNYDTEIEI